MKQKLCVNLEGPGAKKPLRVSEIGCMNENNLLGDTKLTIGSTVTIGLTDYLSSHIEINVIS